jgi:branched-chain amino acid transport system substrate-binding protein
MRKLCVSLVIAVFCLATSAANSAEPIKIGFIFVMSGPLGLPGSIGSQGANLAIEEINASGGVLGRKVEAIFEDSGGDENKATAAFKKLVQEDKVDAVMGVILSPVAIALMPVVKEQKTPLIVTTAPTPVVTGPACNRYTFRVAWNSDQFIRGAAVVAATTAAKKWTTIGPDNVLGTESWKLFQKYVAAKKPGIKFSADSEAQFAPMTTTDWSGQIKNLMSRDADGVLITLWGDNFIGFVRQANALGFFDGKRECVATVVAVNTLISLGSGAPVGLWVISPYWHSIPGKANADFVHAYLKKYNMLPANPPQFAYAAVKAYAAAVQKTGTTDKEAVVDALEGFTFEAPLGPITIRREDHQAIHSGFAGRISEQMDTGQKILRSLGSTIILPAEEVETPLAQTGCKMQ